MLFVGVTQMYNNKKIAYVTLCW